MVVAARSFVDSVESTGCFESVEDGVRVLRIDLLADRSSSAFETSYDNPQVASIVERVVQDFTPDVMHLFSGYLMSASVVRVSVRHQVPIVASLTDYWWLCHRITLIRTNGERCDGPSAVECARCHAETQRRYRLPSRLARPFADSLWEAAGRYDRLGAFVELSAQETRKSALTSILNQCAALICPSRYLADFYARHGVDEGLMRVWRQGVNVDRCPTRSKSETLRVGCLGQVKSHKGIDLLVDAWSRLSGDRPRHLYIYGSSAGEPDYGSAIRATVNALDDVTWPGEFRGNEIWGILKELDVIAVPSRWVENSPNTILEAQAMGLPVVAARLGAMPELVSDGRNGLLFNPDDPVDLSRQLQRLLDEPDLIDDLRSRPMDFKNVEQEIDELYSLYAELTGHGASRRSAAALSPHSRSTNEAAG